MSFVSLSWLEAQAKLNESIQKAVIATFPSQFTSFLLWFSIIGSGSFVTVSSSLVRWIIDPTLGFRMVESIGLIAFIASSLKCTFGMPRPYWLNKDIARLDPNIETSFGFPSGHTICVFISSDVVLRRIFCDRTRKLIHFIIMSTICFSRIITGAHFLHDVIGGVIVGQITVLLRKRFCDRDLPPIFWVFTILVSNYVCLSYLNHDFQLPFERVYELIESGGLGIAFLVVSLIKNHRHKMIKEPRVNFKFNMKQIWQHILTVAIGLAGLALLDFIRSSLKKNSIVRNDENAMMLPIFPYFGLQGIYCLIMLWIELAVPFIEELITKKLRMKYKNT